MNISIYIPDDKVAGIIDAFTAQFGYKDTVPNPDYDPNDTESPETIANPESRGHFTLQQIRLFIKNVYVAGEVAVLDEQRDPLIAEATEAMEDVTIA